MNPRSSTRLYPILRKLFWIGVCVALAAIALGHWTGVLDALGCGMAFIVLAIFSPPIYFVLRRKEKEAHQRLSVGEKYAADFDARLRLTKGMGATKRMMVLFGLGGVVAQLAFHGMLLVRIAGLMVSIFLVGSCYYAFKNFKTNLNKLDTKLQQPETGELA